MSEREPGHAAFEAQPLGPKRRRTDPVTAVVAVIVLGIGLAVAKPWGGDDRAARSPAPGIAGQPSESLTAPPTATPRVAQAVAWRQVAGVVTPRGRWGIRAIVDTGRPAAGSAAEDAAASRLAERWRPITEGVGSFGVMKIETGDRPVVALGITFPPDRLPLDIRVWQATGDGGWAWAAAAPLDATPAFGGLLLGPPMLRGEQLPHWPAGRYRIDVLAGDAILHHVVGIPSRFDRVPATGDPATPADASLVSPFAPTFGADAAPGAFIVEDGQVRGVEGPPVAPRVTPAALWRDGTASIRAPRATGLGVLLPDGATGATATLRTMAPVEGPSEGRRVIGLRLDDGRTPFVVFRAPRGAPWPPGTYVIDSAWTQDGEPRQASYAIELLPGPAGEPSTPLVALRAFAGAAGRPQAIVGIPSFAGDPGDLTCLEATNATITEAPALIGIGHEEGAPPDRVSTTLRLAGLRTAEQPVLLAREPIPGLSLIAPVTADAFVPGVYRLRVETAGALTTHTLCAGVIITD